MTSSTDKALEATAKALIDIDPCISGHHESHVALKLPYAKAAISACLSALPGEAEVEATAWEGYWPGAGSVNSVTRVTTDRRTAEAWASDGAEVTPIASLQAMQARAEKAERERDALEDALTEKRRDRIGDSEIAGAYLCRAEAAEARVKELEDKYEPKERVFEFKGRAYRAVKSIEKGFYGQPINVIKVTALKGGSNG